MGPTRVKDTVIMTSIKGEGRCGIEGWKEDVVSFTRVKDTVIMRASPTRV